MQANHYCQGQLHGNVSSAVAQSATLTRAPLLVLRSSVTVLKVLIFKQGTLHSINYDC